MTPLASSSSGFELVGDMLRRMARASTDARLRMALLAA
jgi:hypothetical protein